MKHYDTHYLMIKTHRFTNLKYLCKKSTNDVKRCFTYLGSGTYWKKHLKKHGNFIETEIIAVCNTKQELKELGIFWSKKLDVVNSDKFANLVMEKGDGGPTMLGRKITKEQKQKQKDSLNHYHKNKTSLHSKIRVKINSLSHAIADGNIYITPKGEFLDCTAASSRVGLCSGSIKKHCIDGYNNRIIDSRRMGRLLFNRKTWAEAGYNIRPLTNKEIDFYKEKLEIYKNILKKIPRY
jgi:hypothetical protein